MITITIHISLGLNDLQSKYFYTHDLRHTSIMWVEPVFVLWTFIKFYR